MKERGRTMAPSKTEKKKAKRKAKLRQEKTRKNLSIQRSQRRFLIDEAVWLREMGNYQDALVAIRHVLRQDPYNEAALREMLIIGKAARNPAVEFAALESLDRAGRMPVFVQPVYCEPLLQRQRFQDARRVAEEGLALLPQARISGKREPPAVENPAGGSRLLSARGWCDPPATDGKNELLQEQEHEMRAIHNLCRTVDTSRKNMVLLDLVRSSADKGIVFVKYQATLQYLSDFLNWERVPHAVFHGGLTSAQKEDHIRLEKGRCKLLAN